MGRNLSENFFEEPIPRSIIFKQWRNLYCTREKSEWQLSTWAQCKFISCFLRGKSTSQQLIRNTNEPHVEVETTLGKRKEQFSWACWTWSKKIKNKHTIIHDHCCTITFLTLLIVVPLLFHSIELTIKNGKEFEWNFFGVHISVSFLAHFYFLKTKQFSQRIRPRITQAICKCSNFGCNRKWTLFPLPHKSQTSF
jgi:hypothetical protein